MKFTQNDKNMNVYVSNKTLAHELTIIFAAKELHFVFGRIISWHVTFLSDSTWSYHVTFDKFVW